MKRALFVGLALAGSLAAMPAMRTAQQADQVAKMSLKVGDTAPDFTLLSDDNGKVVKLSDYHGKKNVFLAVYVLAFTGG